MKARIVPLLVLACLLLATCSSGWSLRATIAGQSTINRQADNAPGVQATTPSNQQPLENAGFEAGIPQPWKGLSGNQITSQNVHSGKYAARIGSDQEARQESIPLQPGRTYTLIAWFKWVEFSGSGWGYDRIEMYTDDGEYIAGLQEMHLQHEQGEWSKVAFTFIPQVDRVTLSFGVFGPRQKAELYFDDFLLLEKAHNASPTLAPKASLNHGEAPLTVNFQANADDLDGAIEHYLWDFGDGSTDIGPNPTHTYISRGSFPVKLTVWDNDHSSAAKNLQVKVTSNSLPEVKIIRPANQQLVTAAETLTVEGQASALPSRVTVSEKQAEGSPQNQITALVWDNISTDEAGDVKIAPAAQVSWKTPPIHLKPGANEILITAIDRQGFATTSRLLVERKGSWPQVSNLSVATESVRVYEKYEVSFDLQTVADQLYFIYDENPPPGVPPKTGVTVEGIFITPSGKTLRQAGFYYKPALQQISRGRPYWEESDRPGHWVVRFSPQEIGEYQVSLHVRDAAGELTRPVGRFTASSPLRPGFVRVSQADPRYFEFSDGSLYWPIGPAQGSDYSKYPGSGLNFERPWLAALGAYSTNFARWLSSARGQTNEGFDSQLSYKEHYPSHELSYEIFYPEGRRLWLGWNEGDIYWKPLEPGARYQVKLRLKVIGLEGPTDPGAPFGFMIKTHGWPEGNLEKELRSVPSLIPVISMDRDWHTILVEYTASERDGQQPYIGLFLDNVRAGRVYIDEFSLRQVLPDGHLGGELIANPRADLHTYVEQRAAAIIDGQIAQGEQYGVYFKYVVYDKRDWVPNHLSAVGTFTEYGDGYYQPGGTKARWLLQQWWRYLIARWGYSTSVHSWELNNEGPPNNSAHYQMAQDFAQFMHQNDAHPHLATTSFWATWQPRLWSDSSKYPDIDYADLHEYILDEDRAEDLTLWLNQTSKLIAAEPPRKPVMMGEFGIGQPDSPSFDELSRANAGYWYHDLLWFQLGPLPVFNPNYFHRRHLDAIDQPAISKPFFLFIQDADFNRGGYIDLAAQVGNPALLVLGQKNLQNGKAFFWIHNRQHTWKSAADRQVRPQSGQVTLQLSPDTTYTVQWWDTYKGEIIRTEPVRTDRNGTLILAITNLESDVAVKIKP